jgi:hypothetical protein
VKKLLAEAVFDEVVWTGRVGGLGGSCGGLVNVAEAILRCDVSARWSATTVPFGYSLV